MSSLAKGQAARRVLQSEMMANSASTRGLKAIFLGILAEPNGAPLTAEQTRKWSSAVSDVIVSRRQAFEEHGRTMSSELVCPTELVSVGAAVDTLTGLVSRRIAAIDAFLQFHQKQGITTDAETCREWLDKLSKTVRLETYPVGEDHSDDALFQAWKTIANRLEQHRLDLRSLSTSAPLLDYPAHVLQSIETEMSITRERYTDVVRLQGWIGRVSSYTNLTEARELGKLVQSAGRVIVKTIKACRGERNSSKWSAIIDRTCPEVHLELDQAQSSAQSSENTERLPEIVDDDDEDLFSVESDA